MLSVISRMRTTRIDIRGHYLYILGVAIIAVGLIVRLFSYPIISADFVASLSHWMDALRGMPGLHAFEKPFSDYPPLYLYFLKFLTLLHGYELYWIKTLSFIFDILLAIVAYLMVKETTDDKLEPGWYFLVFAVVVSLPTVILNSSMWGQSDSIYASLSLLCLYFIMRDKPLCATLSFGAAFSFKLQSIFIAPVLVGYFLSRHRRKEWPYLLLVPAIYILTLVPAVTAGGSFVGLLLTYIHQSGEFSQLSLSAPSVYSFINGNGVSAFGNSFLSWIGYVIAFAIAIYIVWATTRIFAAAEHKPGLLGQEQGQPEARTAQKILIMGLLAAITIPFFLSHMHDRYFYMADALSTVFAFSNPRYWFVPVLSVAASFFSYMPFLSGQVPLFGRLIVPEGYLGILMLMAIIILWTNTLNQKN